MVEESWEILWLGQGSSIIPCYRLSRWILAAFDHYNHGPPFPPTKCASVILDVDPRSPCRAQIDLITVVSWVKMYASFYLGDKRRDCSLRLLWRSFIGKYSAKVAWYGLATCRQPMIDAILYSSAPKMIEKILCRPPKNVTHSICVIKN